MFKIRISAVKYSNTYPLLYGLLHSGIELNADIEIDHPADCARKVSAGEADIGLVPVVIIPSIPGLSIIGDYCIGTEGPVRTVLLLSNKPVNTLDTIYLDHRSRTSVALTRLLAHKFWKCRFKYKDTSEDFNFTGIADNEGVVLIGDQCYDMESDFSYKTDLAVEWNKYTGMPFVFACWVSNKTFSEQFIAKFNKALEYGVNSIDRVVDYYRSQGSMPPDVLDDYLNNNIDYIFDNRKKKAMNTFFDYLEEINKPGIYNK
ncbi:MAG: menaquinone biosynthesis protein [Bacteroidales bacterium]|nr:menaquinone biosynthesis protein [Bacteroidales bacterium]